MEKELKEVALGLLKAPEKNTRIHPEKQISEMRRSLQKWGQYKNIVIDENHTVLAGNGLVSAMRACGMKTAQAVILRGLFESVKKKLMMADNKTAGLGVDNLGAIEEFINSFAGDFDIPGFDDDILKSISASASEISRALEDYGKATAGKLEGIDASAGVNGGEEGAGDSPRQESARKSVSCPECRARVWL